MGGGDNLAAVYGEVACAVLGGKCRADGCGDVGLEDVLILVRIQVRVVRVLRQSAAMFRPLSPVGMELAISVSYPVDLS